MTVNCPKCGSEKLNPKSDPLKIDEEVHQILLQQSEVCGSCGYTWVDMWWEVWTPEGIKTVTVPFKNEGQHGITSPNSGPIGVYDDIGDIPF